MATLALAKLQTYGVKTSDYCTVGEVLDPRNKGCNIEKTVVAKVMEKYVPEYQDEELEDPKAPSTEHKQSTPVSQLALRLFSPRKKSTKKNENELTRYLREPTIAPSCDILVYWKSNQYNYPTLAKMAKDFLCVSATSVPTIFIRRKCHHRLKTSTWRTDDTTHHVS